MEDNKQDLISGYTNLISYECTKKILEQMEKYIYKINMGQIQGTGFFCKIPFLNIHILITTNHIINQ